MIKNILLFTMVYLLSLDSFSQAHFLSSAKIEFERKINIWATLKGNYADQLKNTTAQYKIDYFDFEFENNKSLYKPGKLSDSKVAFFGAAPASDNIVYSDFEAKKYLAQKNVFEKTYLVEDSLRNATWKITDDFREIAGFNCRRATTIIMDSVFVVAFYTDELMITGGPESINGLPGMILGLVINRLHTTWYATKVSVTGLKPGSIVPPSRGTRVNNNQILNIVLPTFSQWGVDAAIALWSVMI